MNPVLQNMNPLLHLVCQVGLLVATFWVTVEWVRTRSHRASEVMAMFLALAIPTLVGMIADEPATAPPWLVTLGNIAVMCHPFTMVRLVKQFRPVPKGILQVIGVGTVLSAAVLLVLSHPVPAAPAGVLAFYFLLVEGWAGWALLDGARTAAGVSRWRMGLAGMGSLSFAVLISLAGLQFFFPDYLRIFQILFTIVSLKMVFCYYLGFAPPLWLWRAWQQDELHQFLIAAQGSNPGYRIGRLQHLLVKSAVRSTAAVGGLLLIQGHPGSNLLRISENLPMDADINPSTGVVRMVLQDKVPRIVTASQNLWSPSERKLANSVDAQTMLVIPLVNPHLQWGALLVFLRQGTLFPDSDLNLLQLLADQYVTLAAVEEAFEEQRRLVVKLQRANREVALASQHKSEFLANMSHELRTPLNAIIGFTQLQLDGTVGPPAPAHEELLRDVLGSGVHLLRMINDILDLAKVEAGKLTFEAREVNMESVVEEVLKSLRPLADEKGLKLRSEIQPLGTVFLDPIRLRQILLNYLSNAIKFTEAGDVLIKISPVEPSSLRIDVVDHGIGIAEENLGRLFHEFEQMDATRAKRYAGTGLGLTLVKRLVEAQGGEVMAESQIGVGSTFTAILPRKIRLSSLTYLSFPPTVSQPLAHEQK